MNLCNHKRRLLGAFLALGWVLFAAGLLVPRVSAVGSGGYQSLETFANILAIVQRNYVKEVETEKLITGAIEGMLGSLDPHSSYLTEDAYRELQTETEGRFRRTGLEITVRNGVLTVISPIEGTPAARAGLQPGDQVVGIDDRSTEELGLADAVKRLRGPKGSSVTISVRREGQEKLLKFTIVRGRHRDQQRARPRSGVGVPLRAHRAVSGPHERESEGGLGQGATRRRIHQRLRPRPAEQPGWAFEPGGGGFRSVPRLRFDRLYRRAPGSAEAEVLRQP